MSVPMTSTNKIRKPVTCRIHDCLDSVGSFYLAKDKTTSPFPPCVLGDLVPTDEPKI